MNGANSKRVPLFLSNPITTNALHLALLIESLSRGIVERERGERGRVFFSGLPIFWELLLITTTMDEVTEQLLELFTSVVKKS